MQTVLLSMIYKIFSAIVATKLRTYYDQIIGDYQSGFRKGRSTMDQIFSRRQNLKKKHMSKM